MKNSIPRIIREVGFDFSWDEEKVWGLKVPMIEMKISELLWHLDIPFLWEGNSKYNLTPREVLDHPEQHPEEYNRTEKADMNHPIDIMRNKGRYVILDGLHRLMKATVLGADTVNVRIIPREKIPEILK